jgi:hypothetical protein
MGSIAEAGGAASRGERCRGTWELGLRMHEPELGWGMSWRSRDVSWEGCTGGRDEMRVGSTGGGAWAEPCNIVYVRFLYSSRDLLKVADS